MKHIFCIICTLSVFYCSAQETLNYDMATSKFDPAVKRYIKEGTALSLGFKNVNPFAFTVTADFDEINHNYEDGMSTVQSGINTIGGVTNKTADNQAALVAMKAKAQTLVTLDGIKKQDVDKSKTYFDKKKELLDDINSAFKDIEQQIISINAVMNMDTLLKVAMNDPANNSVVKMKAAVFAPVSVYRINTPEDIASITKSGVQSINNHLQDISRKAASLELLSDALPKDAAAVEKKRTAALVDSINKKVTALGKVYSGANASILQGNAGSLSQNATRLMNADYNIPTTKVATAKGDFIEISDSLKDHRGKPVLIIEPFRIKTYGGSRVDFSIGLAVNIGGNGADYNLRKNPENVKLGPDTAKVTLYKSNKVLAFSPVIHVHWYRTTKGAVQWMLTTGLAPDFSTFANSRLFVGTSLGFPASNDLAKRLLFSIGASAGYADVLKNKYRSWNDYARFGSIEDADLTTKSVRIGGFFSVSYNLGGTGHNTTATNQ